MYQVMGTIDIVFFPDVEVDALRESNGERKDGKNVWWQMDLVDNGLWKPFYYWSMMQHWKHVDVIYKSWEEQRKDSSRLFPQSASTGRHQSDTAKYLDQDF